jgi:hypothetical protein
VGSSRGNTPYSAFEEDFSNVPSFANLERSGSLTRSDRPVCWRRFALAPRNAFGGFC